MSEPTPTDIAGAAGNTAMARRWRAIAAELLRDADALEASGGDVLERLHAPMTESELLAADYIRANAGAPGKAVAAAARVTPEHFRRSIVPKLKQHGFTNNGNGYNPPACSAASALQPRCIQPGPKRRR